MDSFKKYFIKPWNSTAILSQDPISRVVWLHLIMAYCVLGCSSISALFGAYSQMFFDIGGWTTALGFVGSLYWMSRFNAWNEPPRVFIFLLAAHFFGLTIGPATNLIVEVDQRYIIKIIMGVVLFCTCQFSAIIHSIDRNVIYQLFEFSTPIFITAWMVIYESYPGFLIYALFLILQPIPWYMVVFVLKHLRDTLRISLNLPIHLAWMIFLSYYFKYTFPDLMFVYILVLGLLSHMRMYNQEVLYLAAHTSDENYYVNTTITFFTEFLARTMSHFVHTATLVMGVIRCYLRPQNTLTHT